MHLRRVSKKFSEAAKMSIVPPADFCVDSDDKYNAMGVMTRAVPNLQQISLRDLEWGQQKYNDGEDPNEGLAVITADWLSLDIGIISNFSKLRILDIDNVELNGRYPVLFNSFPLLQKLRITECKYLKWDLGMLAGMPLLKELDCVVNRCLTGNISSLRVLKDTLEKVNIYLCENVEGNLMDLADFPRLKELYLRESAVIGDIRDIDNNDFSSLERLTLPKGVYGGRGYEVKRIADAPDVVRSVYLFGKQRPALFKKMLSALIITDNWCVILSKNSPDWYEEAGNPTEGFFSTPPFYTRFVEAGSRIGYRWENFYGDPCEVIWLDPEPDPESSDYAKYIEELQEINSSVNTYRGFHQPPTEEEYNRLYDEHTRLEEGSIFTIVDGSIRSQDDSLEEGTVLSFSTGGFDDDDGGFL